MKKLAQQLSMKLSGLNSKQQVHNDVSQNVDSSSVINSLSNNIVNNKTISDVNESADVNFNAVGETEESNVDINSPNNSSSCVLEDMESKNVNSDVSDGMEKNNVNRIAEENVENKDVNSNVSTEIAKNNVNSSCSSVSAIQRENVKEEVSTSSSVKREDEDNQSLKKKHRKHKKHKKHKKRKDIEFEGETVPHLVQHETACLPKAEVEERRNLATQDEYVLKKLFDKSGLQTAMKHDSIMEGGPSDYAIVECEADKVAKEAVEALKKSRRECWRASAGVPTFTGQNGAIRQSSETRSRFGPKKVVKPGSGSASGSSSSASCSSALAMSSADLIKRIRERNLMKLPEDSDIRLLNDIREFILTNGGTALTDQLVGKFQARLPAGKSPLFKSLLSKISVFYRAPDNKGYWTLRDEFSW